MYWFRNDSFITIFPWVITAAAWFLGGWLIATHAFRIKKNERILFGFGIGLMLYLNLLNLLGRFMPSSISFVVPALCVLAGGLVYVRINREKLIDFKDLSIWPLLLLWAVLFIYSLLLERGLVIFDDQYHLSSASLMGAGRIPPIYFLNANFNYSYHYGFDLLGATLIKLGGLFPWSAVDIAKALLWSYSLILIGFILYEFLHSRWKSILGTVVFSFLSGTRYLLMLLPQNILQSMDESIGLMGASASLNTTFSKSIFLPFTAIPGPSQPYLFGLYNGIYSSYHMFHTGEYTLSFAIIILIWLLSTRIKSWNSLPILVLLWTHLSLTSESAYGLLALSIFVYFLFQKVFKKPAPQQSFNILLVSLIASIPIAIFQGGAVTEILRDGLQSIFNKQAVMPPIGTATTSFMAFNWPPTIISGNFTDLSLFNPAQLLVGLLEIGPILFFLPAIFKWGFRKFATEQWMTGIVALFALLGILIPVFISVGMLRNSIIRFTTYALVFAYILFIMVLFQQDHFKNKVVKILVYFCTVLMSVAGAGNFITQLSAIRNPVLAEHITGLDARICSQVWGKFSQSDVIFDPNGLPGRAVELTGIATVIKPGHFYKIDLSLNLPAWDKLSANPTLQGFLNNGFRYVYVDETWWGGLSKAQKDSLSNTCIQEVAEAAKDNQFRRLLDLEQCKQVS
jgi:hypothetical protein